MATHSSLNLSVIAAAGGPNPLAKAQTSRQQCEDDQCEDETDSAACATDQCVRDDEAAIILAFLANLESDEFPPLMVIASAHDADFLAEARASPLCDSALLADAKNSSAFTEMPTISYHSNADDDAEVLSTFGADECAEVGSTTTSQNFLVAEYAVISTFLATLHELQVHANLHPSVETPVLLHVSDADFILAMNMPYVLLSIVAEYISAMALETQCYSVPADLIEVYPSNIFHATSKAEPLKHTTGRLPFGSLPTNGNYLIHHSCRGMIFKAFNLALYIMLYMDNLLLMCGSSTARSLLLPRQAYDPFDTGIPTLLKAC